MRSCQDEPLVHMARLHLQRGPLDMLAWSSRASIFYQASIRDLACTGAPATIRTNHLDPWLLSETQLLLAYIWYSNNKHTDCFKQAKTLYPAHQTLGLAQWDQQNFRPGQPLARLSG